MNCNDLALWIPEFVDGDMPEADQTELRSHLDACATCRAEVAKYQALVKAARSLPSQEPGLDLVLRVSKAIHAVTPPPRRTAFGPVLDTEELADYLRVDAATIHHYLTEIPCFELGGKILFRRSSVDAWLEHREASFSHGTGAGASQVFYVSQPTAIGGVPWQN